MIINRFQIVVIKSYIDILFHLILEFKLFTGKVYSSPK